MSVNLNVEQIKRLQSALKDQATDVSDIQFELENALKSTMHVNVYAVTRHFGGPEEGGWWYDVGELVEDVETTLEEAEAVKAELAQKHADVQDGDRHSACGGTDLQVEISEEPGRNWPEHTPHYE